MRSTSVLIIERTLEGGAYLYVTTMSSDDADWIRLKSVGPLWTELCMLLHGAGGPHQVSKNITTYKRNTNLYLSIQNCMNPKQRTVAQYNF